MILLGSHNTFTYLKPTKWYHYFCIPFARCQTKTIQEQIKSGIRIFDIRVRFDNNGDMYLCHGLFRVKHDLPNKKYPYFIDWLLDTIVTSQVNEQFIFRLVLETAKANDIQEMWFKNFCKTFDEKLKDTKHFIITCVRKFDWKQLYHAKNDIQIFQHISSYSSYPEAIKVRWYERICPWLYAKRTNAKFLENFKNGVYKKYTGAIYDFV